MNFGLISRHCRCRCLAEMERHWRPPRVRAAAIGANAVGAVVPAAAMGSGCVVVFGQQCTYRYTNMPCGSHTGICRAQVGGAAAPGPSLASSTSWKFNEVQLADGVGLGLAADSESFTNSQTCGARRSTTSSSASAGLRLAAIGNLGKTEQTNGSGSSNLTGRLRRRGLRSPGLVKSDESYHWHRHLRSANVRRRRTPSSC